MHNWYCSGVRALILSSLTLTLMAGDSYIEEVEKWRQQSEERLKSDDGWLTVSGLHWLRQTDTKFGSAKDLPIRLPDGYPPIAGIFRVISGRVQVIPMEGVPLLVNGEPVLNASLLTPDTEGQPDVVRLRDISLSVIQRGDRIGIRMRDKNSEFRRSFTAKKWFPVDARYRVSSHFTPYPKPITRRVPTVLEGVEEDQEAIGMVEFVLNGQTLKLEALQANPREIWFVFRDKTAGKQTYPAARFVYAPNPKGGRTTLDFNKAYNPPCAYNPYTTCPLPVKQNILPVAIEAGELKYEH